MWAVILGCLITLIMGLAILGFSYWLALRKTKLKKKGKRNHE